MLAVNNAKAINQKFLIKVMHIALNAKVSILCSVGSRYGRNDLYFFLPMVYAYFL